MNTHMIELLKMADHPSRLLLLSSLDVAFSSHQVSHLDSASLIIDHASHLLEDLLGGLSPLHPRRRQRPPP